MNSKFYFNPTWTTTRQGLNIPLWSSHAPTTDAPCGANPPILFIGGVHGDEPEGVWLAEAFLNALFSRQRKTTHTARLNPSFQWPRKPFVIIPCLNPEGYALNQRTNSGGVDLNRNFPSPDWSPEFKAPRYFPGTTPGSEPEVQGVIRAIELFKPKAIIHFHSWKPCVVYTGEPGKTLAQFLGEHSGYPYHEDIGYPTPGSLGQFGWLTHQIPVVCIEEQEGAARPHIWRRFQWALMELLA